MKATGYCKRKLQQWSGNTIKIVTLKLKTMKKNLLLIIVLALAFNGLKAQKVVFKDDFEGYTEGFSLSDTSYVIWEGGATVVVGAANSGTKYAKCVPSANNFYLRKTLTLEVGKTYFFEVMTKSPDAKNHRAVAKLGSRTIQGDLLNKTEWTKTTINFTVSAGETEAIFWVYSFPVSEVHVDDFKIAEEGATKVSALKKSDITVLPTSSNGMFRISGSEAISECTVYNLNGQMIKKYANVNSTEAKINLTDSPNGLYILHVKDAKGIKEVKKIFR